MKTDYNTHANLAEYWAKLGNKPKALAEINRIAPAARGPFIDRIVLAYELSGERSQAIAAVKSLPPGDPLLTYIKSDPDLESLRRDSTLALLNKGRAFESQPPISGSGALPFKP